MSSERYIPEHRRTQFKAKNTFKPDELRRRREEQQVEIRKAKREENLAKRRGITGRDGTQSSAPGASLGASIDSDDEGGTIESQVCWSHALSRCQIGHVSCQYCDLRFVFGLHVGLCYRSSCLCLIIWATTANLKQNFSLHA